MTYLTRRNPFRELDEMQRRLSDLLGRTPIQKETREEAMRPADWAPVVDVIEEEKEYRIKAELPEIKRDAIKIAVEQGVLTFSGERSFEKEETDKKYHRIERGYGSFERSFTLPADAEEERITADLKDGVLTIRIPRSKKAGPKAIEVKGA